MENVSGLIQGKSFNFIGRLKTVVSGKKKSNFRSQFYFIGRLKTRIKRVTNLLPIIRLILIGRLKPILVLNYGNYCPVSLIYCTLSKIVRIGCIGKFQSLIGRLKTVGNSGIRER